MKKFATYLLATACVVGTLWTNKYTGYCYDFDANYYARKYPDVVAVVGNDPTALHNHYITNGEKEGRYVCQAEETEYFSKGITKKDIVNPGSNVVNTAPAAPTTPAAVTTPTEPITTKAPITEPIAPFSTYVDVDIEAQTVTYFENGVLKIQTPCVTGNVKAGRSTPTGTFTINQHQTNRYLIGPTWRSYVSYWMRFTYDGCGLHDASWRSNFGGEIYKTSGSHGCVNMPYDAAKALYDVTNIGTVVYVH